MASEIPGFPCADPEDPVAVVPFGGGTSVVGGVEVSRTDATVATVALDLARLDRVLEVDLASRSARIQAGARGRIGTRSRRTRR